MEYLGYKKTERFSNVSNLATQQKVNDEIRI